MPHTTVTVSGESVTHDLDVWKECECKEQRRIDRAFDSSKITWEFQKKTFDNFSLAFRPEAVRDAYHCARDYASRFGSLCNLKNNSIALLGRPGSGKTHLLMAVSNELMGQGKKVLYFPWVEGFSEIKDDLSMTEERTRRMQQVDVLYIDDMFKGRREPTPFQIEVAFAVINHRYMEKKPILVSSERDIDQICDIDEGLGSRINEMCKDYRVLLKGGREMNYRLRDEEDVG